MTTKSEEQDLLDDLEWRGLIQDVSRRDELRVALRETSVTVYAGYDPTADSLHIGNLLIIMLLKRMQMAGHQVIALAGGGTGLIGDPSGKADERQLQDEVTVHEWGEQITKQLTTLLRPDGCEKPPIHANNADWITQLSAVSMLRDLGRHFTIASMLAKDSVRSRLGGEGGGLSYTEFSYSLLQAYDFQMLFDEFACRMQVGGSDQWGNITAGLDLLRRTGRNGAFGLTTPLITRSDGRKFGKSEQGAVWLAANRTSPFSMYQYFVNIPDADVGTMLRQLTFLSREEICDLEEVARVQPQERVAQRALARAVVTFVHGETATEEAETITRHLFAGSMDELDRDTLERALNGAPLVDLSEADIASWESLILAAGLEESRSSARRTLRQGGIYLNERRILIDELLPKPAMFGPLGVAVLRRGARIRVIVRLPG